MAYRLGRGTLQITDLIQKESRSLRSDLPYASPECFSPDGRLLAVGGQGATRIIDVATGKTLKSLPETGRFTKFSPDGRWLIWEDDGDWQVLDITRLPRPTAR